MHMLRTLFEARHTFCLMPQYIETKVNHLADDLWRNMLSSFVIKVPQADTQPTPLHLLDYSWTKPSTGPLLAGSICSALLSGRTRGGGCPAKVIPAISNGCM